MGLKVKKEREKKRKREWGRMKKALWKEERKTDIDRIEKMDQKKERR